jgi:hypothetical protein
MRKLLSISLFVLGLSAVAPATLLAAPQISSVSPLTATVGIPTSLSATITSASPLSTCRLYVDLEDVGAMTITGSQVSKSFTFPSGGSRIAFVFCRDTSGGMASGPNTAIWVQGQIVTTPPLTTPAPTLAPPTTVAGPEAPYYPTTTPVIQNPLTTAGNASVTRQLVKLACPDGALADHPCRAVYYVGVDSRRHAYPNEKTFFTWYPNFDTVNVVPESYLSTLPLGKNVTYRPGVRMVKFQTLSNVYAVDAAGVLRWIKSEQIAQALYGDNWNQQIDDIADAFYSSYTFGSDIDSATEYAPSVLVSSHPTFD